MGEKKKKKKPQTKTNHHKFHKGKKWKKKVETNMFLWSTVLNSGFTAGLEVFVAVANFRLRSSAQRCLTAYQELMGSTAETCLRLALVVTP